MIKPLAPRPINFCSAAIFTIVLCAVSFAQQIPTPTVSPTPKKESEAKKIEAGIEDVFRLKPRRPTVSRSAELIQPGFLQIEYGFNPYYRARDYRSQQAGTLSLLFAATEKIGLEFDFDTFSTQTDANFNRSVGVGDARLGAQFNLVEQSGKSPSFALAYFAKLPVASASKKLGTGRVDHQFIALLSKTVRGTDIDFNAALLVNGKQNSAGFVRGGQIALGFARDLPGGFGVQGEIYGETKDADEPQGLFALGALTYKLNSRATFDIGVKSGLTTNAPRFGFVAGITFGAGNIYKKRK